MEEGSLKESNPQVINKIVGSGLLIVAFAYVVCSGYPEAMVTDSASFLRTFFGILLAVGFFWFLGLTIYYLGKLPFSPSSRTPIKDALGFSFLSFLCLVGTLRISTETSRLTLAWGFALIYNWIQ